MPRSERGGRAGGEEGGRLWRTLFFAEGCYSFTKAWTGCRASVANAQVSAPLPPHAHAPRPLVMHSLCRVPVRHTTTSPESTGTAAVGETRSARRWTGGRLGASNQQNCGPNSFGSGNHTAELSNEGPTIGALVHPVLSVVKFCCSRVGVDALSTPTSCMRCRSIRFLRSLNVHRFAGSHAREG